VGRWLVCAPSKPPFEEVDVASNSKQTKIKRKRRHRNAGRQRKNTQAKRSTLSDAELFAGCGEPGQPAPARAS
jgi:hypothetical protein